MCYSLNERVWTPLSSRDLTGWNQSEWKATQLLMQVLVPCFSRILAWTLSKNCLLPLSYLVSKELNSNLLRVLCKIIPIKVQVILTISGVFWNLLKTCGWKSYQDLVGTQFQICQRIIILVIMLMKWISRELKRKQDCYHWWVQVCNLSCCKLFQTHPHFLRVKSS